MISILTEKSFAATRCPLHSGEQQSVAIFEGKQLLLGAGAETLFAHHVAAFVFQKG